MIKSYRGRIAPTPSGYLHIGHLQTFKIACRRAIEANGKIVFRLEDADEARCSEVYRRAAVEDLKLAGLDWDEGGGKKGNFAPYEQSQRSSRYWEKIKELAQGGVIYPSCVSRTQIADYALYASDGEPIFPEELRPPFFRDTKCIGEFLKDEVRAKKTNWRFAVENGKKIEFHDENFGKQSFVSGKDFSDFLVWRKDGFASYELAVVCDDIEMEITEVVRGADLLKSTARQLLLYRAFHATPPAFYHCPLLLDNLGKKISKSGIKSASNPSLIRNFLRAKNAKI